MTTTPQADLSDDEIIRHLEAAGVNFQRFMGGIAGTKDCWTTSGSQDARTIVAGVRAILAKLQATQAEPVQAAFQYVSDGHVKTDPEIAKATAEGFCSMFEPVQAGELPDEREAFEAWYAKHASDVIGIDVSPEEIATCRIGDGYSEEGSYLNGAWSGYRAALSARKPLTDAISTEREACAIECEKLMRHYWRCDGDVDLPDGVACAKAIRARAHGIGLEVKP